MERLEKVPTVVPEIPVIHRLVTENFAFATHPTGAWSSSDRGGRPSLSPESRQRLEGLGRGRRTDLRRQDWGEPSGSNRASREEAPEEEMPSRATRLPDLLVGFGERSGTQEMFPQEGPRNIGRF